MAGYRIAAISLVAELVKSFDSLSHSKVLTTSATKLLDEEPHKPILVAACNHIGNNANIEIDDLLRGHRIAGDDGHFFANVLRGARVQRVGNHVQ